MIRASSAGSGSPSALGSVALGMVKVSTGRETGLSPSAGGPPPGPLATRLGGMALRTGTGDG